MDTPTAISSLISELKSIRLVLLAILALLAILLCMFYAIFRGLNRAVAVVAKETNEKALQQELEGLLTRGLANDAFFLATENVARRPRDPYVYWYLGQANFQLKKFVEAKQAFLRVMEISPNWEATVHPWLQKVETEIANAGPKVVK